MQTSDYLLLDRWWTSRATITTTIRELLFDAFQCSFVEQTVLMRRNKIQCQFRVQPMILGRRGRREGVLGEDGLFGAMRIDGCGDDAQVNTLDFLVVVQFAIQTRWIFAS